MYHSSCGRRGEKVNFKEIGKIGNSDQRLFLVEFKQIDTTFFPRHSTFSMLLQRFLRVTRFGLLTHGTIFGELFDVIAHTDSEHSVRWRGFESHRCHHLDFVMACISR